MSTVHAPPRSRAQAFVDAVRSEWAKLVTLPATWLVLGGTLALTIVLSWAFAAQARLGEGSVGVLDFGVTALGWSQCGFFLLGVAAATSEHVGGQIRTTLVAMPDRTAQRLAGVVALVGLAAVASLVTVSASVATVLAVTRRPITEVDPATGGRVLVGAAGYLVCMTVLSSALGFIVRRMIPTAAGILVYLLILSPLLQGQDLYWLPDMASYSLWYATVPETAPPQVVAWAVVVAWTLAALSVSLVVYRRRDV